MPLFASSTASRSRARRCSGSHLGCRLEFGHLLLNAPGDAKGVNSYQPGATPGQRPRNRYEKKHSGAPTARFFRPFGTWLAFGLESQRWNAGLFSLVPSGLKHWPARQAKHIRCRQHVERHFQAALNRFSGQARKPRLRFYILLHPCHPRSVSSAFSVHALLEAKSGIFRVFFR